MKKLILFVVCFFICSLNVFAIEKDSVVEVKYENKIFSNRQIGEQFYSGQQGIVYINGIVGYCLDATITLNEKNYSSTRDFSVANITSEQLHYLEVVSNFGYGYNGRDDNKYYLATQEIIWEYLTGGSVYWTDGNSGKVINIDSYKNEIFIDINNYLSIPDIPSYVETYQYENVILEDKNNTLKNYESASLSGTIEEGRLLLNADFGGKTNILLMKKPLNNKVSYVYVCENSQMLATFGYSGANNNHITISYKVKTLSQVTLTKKDLNTGKIIKQRETKIRVFDVNRGRYIEENGSDVLIIGASGQLTLEKTLEEGEYLIEEIEAPAGYIKMTEVQVFYVETYSGPIENVDIYNYPVYYSIDLRKKGEVYIGVKEENGKLKGKYDIRSIDNVKYGLYARQNILDGAGNIIYNKDSLVTYINIEAGLALVSGLPYGYYYLKQLECPDEFILSDEVTEINLTGEKRFISIELINVAKKGNIIIHKTDGENGLQGAEFLLQDEKYQYPINIVTDILGYSIIEDIPYDTYILKETKAPVGYLIDNEQKTIVLQEENLEYELVNKKEIIEIPDGEDGNGEGMEEKEPTEEPDGNDSSVVENGPIEDKDENKIVVEEEQPKLQESKPLEEPSDNIIDEDLYLDKNDNQEINLDEKINNDIINNENIENSGENLSEYVDVIVENPNTSVTKNNTFLNILILLSILFGIYNLKA